MSSYRFTVPTLLFPLFLAAPAFAQDATPGAPPGPPPGPPPGAPPPPAMAPVAPPPDDSSRSANNALFIELGGNGFLYSINYERFFADNVSLRIGFSYLGVSATNPDGTSASVSLMTFPVLANYYLGGANHKLQLGLGATFVDVSASVSTGIGSAFGASGFIPVGTGVIGYRYVPHDGGFDFGIGITPLFGSFGLIPSAGLSLGAVFGP